ncbi:MAG: hypothetical protein ACMUJM_10460 [bacterium]
MKEIKRLLIVLAIGFIFFFGLISQALSCVGARAMALGGAFIALADDVNAVYWNPAGLTQLQQKELTYTRTIFNRDEFNYDDFIAFVQPVAKGRGAIGFSYINSGYNLWDFRTVSRWYVLSCGVRILKNLSLGGNIRYQYDRISRFEYMVGFKTDDDTSMGIDLAIHWKPIPQVSMGLLVQSFNEPRINIFSYSSLYMRNVRPSIAFYPTDNITCIIEMYDAEKKSEHDYVDVSQDLRIGFEDRITDNFSLRGGAYHFNSITDGLKAYTFGYGYTFPKIPFSIDYLLMHWTSNVDAKSYTHQLGIMYRW